MKAEELGNCHETSLTKVISQSQNPIHALDPFLLKKLMSSQTLLGQYTN
jgi:hypothetical protein